MKKKIEGALSAEYKGLGLSEKTIGRLADYIVSKGSVTKEEEIDAAVKGDDVKLLATSIQGEVAGLQRAKETAETALADYKAKHPEEGGGGGSSQEIEQLKTELANQKSAFETLKADYTNQIKQGQYNQLRELVKGKAGELNVSNVPIWNDVVAAVAIDDKSTAETILEAVKTAYEAKLKSYIGDGAAPYRGEGSSKPAEVSAEDKAAKAKEDAARVRGNG